MIDSACGTRWALWLTMLAMLGASAAALGASSATETGSRLGTKGGRELSARGIRPLWRSIFNDLKVAWRWLLHS